jgi:succinate-semialdehyde dehydrogenase/glutarate-semialdehyde dehydrogenase
MCNRSLRDGVGEAQKCALGCDFYAEHAERFLAREPVTIEARKSFVTFNPLRVILAVMPWNFPFWQAFRSAAPGLMAGNAAVLKHASNEPACALAIVRFAMSSLRNSFLRRLAERFERAPR